jgi:hypothetical protein
MSLLPPDFTATSGLSISKTILGKLLDASANAQSEIITDRLAAAVEIITPQITAQGLTVDHIASVNDAISFMNDAIFFGRPYFNQDTAGFAVVKSGDKSVDVAFDREYLEQPIVNTTISMENSGSEDAIFAANVQYMVTKKSVKGFTILLNKPAPTDMNFSWTAFAVKNAHIFTSNAASTTPTAEVASPPPTLPDTSSTSSGDSGTTGTSTESLPPDDSTAPSEPAAESTIPDSNPIPTDSTPPTTDFTISPGV